MRTVKFHEKKRQRARMVGKGFSQIYGVDYEEIFAPLISFPTLKTPESLPCQPTHRWGLRQPVVETANFSATHHV